MGKLYEYCQRIQRHIDDNQLDVFKARGAIALKCGFLISLIGPDEPDDPVRIQALREAAREVFDLQLD